MSRPSNVLKPVVSSRMSPGYACARPLSADSISPTLSRDGRSRARASWPAPRGTVFPLEAVASSDGDEAPRLPLGVASVDSHVSALDLVRQQAAAGDEAQGPERKSGVQLHGAVRPRGDSGKHTGTEAEEWEENSCRQDPAAGSYAMPSNTVLHEVSHPSGRHATRPVVASQMVE